MILEDANGIHKSARVIFSTNCRRALAEQAKAIKEAVDALPESQKEAVAQP